MSLNVPEGHAVTQTLPAIYLNCEATKQFYTQVYVLFYPNKSGLIGQTLTHILVELSA